MQEIKIKINSPPVEECIYFGCRMQQSIARRIIAMGYDKVVLVVDKLLFLKQKEYIESLAKICKTGDIIFVNPKPHYKNFDHCRHLLKKLISCQFNRKSCLVALGGGYVADMAGFVASIFMRGVDFIQIPSTLMSMADAVIGKVAINFEKHKNLLGSFHSPKFIFVDIHFLTTLSNKEKFFGLVEIWKHALLVGDESIVQGVENCLSGHKKIDEMKLIASSLEIKRRFVVLDYQDRLGSHKALSLGHTFANYLEANHDLRHGPAVFYGIILAALLSYNFGMIDANQFKRILATAKFFEYRIRLFKGIQNKLRISEIVSRLKFDKINSNGSYTFVLLTKNGYCVKKGIKEATLKKALKQFKSLEF